MATRAEVHAAQATGTVYVLTIPVYDPSQFLQANKRPHWAVKARRVDYWRSLAKGKAMEAIRNGALVPVDRARIVITITWRTHHRRDPGNWAPTGKALVDGIVDAGVLPDDDMTRVIGPDMRGAVDPCIRFTTVQVAITPLGAEDDLP